MSGVQPNFPSPYIATPDRAYINLCLYSDPGVGKTTFACQSQDHPDMADVLLCNIEGGTISISGRGDILTVDIDDPRHLESVFWELKRGEDGMFGKVRTVVIDSGSELQAIDLEQTVDVAVRKAIEKAGGDITKAKRDDLDDIWLEDYKRSGAHISRVFRWFRDLPVNTVITALAKEVYPPSARKTAAESTTPSEVKPQFTKSLASAVMGFVDFVWYMYEHTGEDGVKRRYLLTGKQLPFHAKTRGPNFRKQLGEIVLLHDTDRPDEQGHTFGSIFELLRTSESGASLDTDRTAASEAG